MKREIITIDGNEAVAYVAYRLNEVIAIYPITPSSGMGELSDAWSAANIPNIWGTVPLVVEMQSEGGAAGAVVAPAVHERPVEVAEGEECHLARRSGAGERQADEKRDAREAARGAASNRQRESHGRGW